MTERNFALKGIDHVVLRVRDIDRMLAFYCDVLGCALVRHNEPLGLYHLSAGTSLIDLITLDGRLGATGGAGPGTEGRNVDHIALKVSPFDADAILSYLAGQGIEAGEAVMRFGAEGEGLSIYLSDPEGNGLELKQV